MLIDTKHGTKPRFLTPAICKDFAGNLFVAATYYNNENGYIGELVLYKIDPAGNKSTVGTRRMTRAKGDGVGICQSGSDILIVMGGHVSDPDTDLELLQAFQGVAVAYPTGMQPGHGGAQGFTETQSDPGGSGVTPEQVEAAVRRVFGIPDGSTFPQMWGADFNAHPPIGYREVIMSKSKQGAQQAISEAGVLTTGNAAQTLYQPIKDRVYEVFSQNVSGFWPWLQAKVRGTQAQGTTPAPASQTAAGPRPDSLDVNVQHAPFDNGQLGMTGQTEEGAQS